MGDGGAEALVIFLIFFFVFILFIFIIPLFKMISRQRKRNVEAEMKKSEITEELNNLKKDILVVSSPDIPCKNIKTVLGLVRGISGQATTEAEFNRAEAEALKNMIDNAASIGANAIISVRLTIGAYDQQGSKWQTSQAVYIGTAVVI